MLIPKTCVGNTQFLLLHFAHIKYTKTWHQHPGEGIGKIAKVTGRMWGSLSPEVKQKYQLLGAEEREAASLQIEALRRSGHLPPAPSKTRNNETSPLDLFLPVARIRKISKLDPVSNI